MKKLYVYFYLLTLLLQIRKIMLALGLQGSSAATESKWSVSVRQLVSGANPLDILMIQEAGTLPRTATPTGRHVQQGGTPIDEYEWELGTLSRPDRVLFIILALM